MTNKRIINIRITTVVFVGLMLGILFCRALFLNKISITTAIILSLLLIVFCGGVYTYAVLTNKHNMMSFAREKISEILKISSIGLILAFLVGIIISFMPYLNIASIKTFDSSVNVSGTICDYVVDGGTHTKFILNDVSIENTDGVYKTNFKVCVYTNQSATLSLGDVLNFECELNKYNIDKTYDDTKLYQGIGYQCYVNVSDIDIISNNTIVKDKIKNATKEILYENLNEDNSNICFAILFGETQGLSDNIQNMFSYAGISHILAVSGLHIGVLFSSIYFILKKLKINKYVRLAVLSIILIFYCYLCSFTPSVCRASIMALLLSLCEILKIDYDSLSSLSIAGIIILLISPVSLFKVSFQLSFLCIFAIITLSPYLNSLFAKLKFPKFLSASLSMSIATNIAILPVCLNVFNKVGFIGILTNVFVLPIFSLTYILVFGIVLISLIFKFMGFLLFIPNLFLQIIKVVTNYMASIHFGIFKAFNVSYWSLVFLIMSAIALKFVMVRNLIKSTLFITLASIVLVFLAINSIPKVYTGNNFVFVSKYNSNVCYYIEDSVVTLIGTKVNKNNIYSDCKKLKVNKITNVIAYDLQLNKLEELIEICKDYNVKNIYLPKKYNYDEIKEKFGNVYLFENKINLCNLEVSTIERNDKIIAIKLNTISSGKILIPFSNLSASDGEYLINNCGTIDIIYLDKTNDNLDITILNPSVTIINRDKVYFKSGNIQDFDVYVYE